MKRVLWNLRRNPRGNRAVPGLPFWDLNLARRPFEKSPAIVALWTFLALLGVVLFAFDAYLVGREGWAIVRAYRAQKQVRSRAERLQAEIGRIRSAIERLDTEAFRNQCAFLNRQMKARFFSWSELLDTLEQALPPGIRLTAVTPQTQQVVGGPVPIHLTLEARDLENFVQLINRLYATRRIADFRMRREAPEPETGLVEYEVAILYRAAETAADEVDR